MNNSPKNSKVFHESIRANFDKLSTVHSQPVNSHAMQHESKHG